MVSARLVNLIIWAPRSYTTKERENAIYVSTATKASHKCEPTNPAPPVTRTRLAPVLGFVLMMVFPFLSIVFFLLESAFFLWWLSKACNTHFLYFFRRWERQKGGKMTLKKERKKTYAQSHAQNIYMFLSSNDFGMILVWWFDTGVIVWLRCDGSEVVFVNVVNAYKSKKLQRNVKQKID